MRRDLWIPLAALALALAAIGGFAAAAVTLSEPGGPEKIAARPPPGAPRVELPPFERPYLGVILGRRAEGGVRVRQVDPGGPADRAGLREGDVIVAVAGREVDDASDILEALEEKEPGDEAVITFRRDGEKHEATATLIPAPPDAGPPERPAAPRFGMFEQPRLGVVVSETDQGVVVEAVLPGSPAADAGLRPGDVILSVDGQAVETAEALTDQIRARRAGQRVRLDIQRDSERHTLDVELGRALAPPIEEAPPLGEGLLGGEELFEALRGLLPELDLNFSGPGLERLLRRFVRADVTLVAAGDKLRTLHVTAGTVRSATAQELVLAPNGGGPDATFAIDGETRVWRGLQRIEASGIGRDETAVVLTVDDERRARAVFLLPEAFVPER